jgi:hypothetical protein
METDKELLEMAARAAWTRSLAIGGEINKRWRVTDAVDPQPSDWRWWDPLTDDGDALRLAVKLRIDLEFADFHAEAYRREADEFYISSEPYRADSRAATRRAIVRAAAEIGRHPSKG